ncbi:MAG: hypothetical protein HY897_23415 [Deltaproteobacteria bacterium]|nr:hypothetical protein [Deltaproteobacteria bacterium]
MNRVVVALFLILIVSTPADSAGQTAPPASPAAAGDAKALDAYKPYPYPGQASGQPPAPAAPTGDGDRLNLDGRLGAGANLRISDGLAGRSGLSLRWWVHRHVGLQADIAAGLWSGKVMDGLSGEKQERREIVPRLSFVFPVVASKWAHFFVSAASGLLVSKPPKEATGIGVEAGAGAGVEFMPIKDPHVSIEFSGGASYFAHKSATLGSGATTSFSTGINYYF